jgi:DNA polymerase III subunit epsilon
VSRQIFLDTETTGLSASAGDRIVEIGCVEMVSRKLSGQNKHFYLNPERSSHPEALKVHGLSDDFLSQKPLFSEIVDELMVYLQGAEIIIHNANFDVSFLDEELRRTARKSFSTQVSGITDSLLMAREIYPGKANSLDALCKRLGVDNTRRQLHGALLDAGLLAQVYICMTRGQNTLMLDTEPENVSSADEPNQPLNIDLSHFNLTVLPAKKSEQAAHEALLAELDKSCPSGALWCRLVA